MKPDEALYRLWEKARVEIRLAVLSEKRVGLELHMGPNFVGAPLQPSEAVELGRQLVKLGLEMGAGAQ